MPLSAVAKSYIICASFVNVIRNPIIDIKINWPKNGYFTNVMSAATGYNSYYLSFPLF